MQRDDIRGNQRSREFRQVLDLLHIEFVDGFQIVPEGEFEGIAVALRALFDQAVCQEEVEWVELLPV